MGAKKKELISSINFGKKGDYSYIIAEELKGRNNRDFSNYIRRLIVIDNMSKHPVHISFIKKKLLYRRQEIGEEIYSLIEEKKKIETKLSELGVDYV